MRSFQRILAGALSAALVLGLTGGAWAARDGSVTIGIYSTTDMHGKCYDVNPITGKDVPNSLLKIPTVMAQEKEKVDHTLLLDNGDIIQGTPIISYNITMEQGVDNPMAICLRYCGYDAATLGNHEFNFTMDVQQHYIDILGDETDKYPGSPVELLVANYINVDSQQSQLKPYTTRTYEVGGKEFKVGIIGFENVNVPNWDPASHYEGADFVHADNTERSYAYEWNHYWQKVLKEDEKCDFVIVLAHSGEGAGAYGAGEETFGEVTGAFSAEDQVYHLVENTTGIDLVVAGHNHKVGVSTHPNAEGKEIPVVNGGASTLTKTVLTVKRDGTFTVGESENLSLTEFENDAGLKALMEPYYERTAPFVEQEIGTLSGAWDDETDLFHVESDTTNLVHEAQLWATGADVSLASPVANKDFCIGQLLEGGSSAPISLKDCYSFYKYDNNTLYMIEATGQQLKDWLEKCVQDYTVDDTGAITGGGFGTDQLYGISYDVYLGNEAGQRVQNMVYQGKPVTAEQKFKVAVNSYRLSANAAGDAYGWYAITGITVGSPQVLWDGCVSPEFGGIGGSATLIIAEYIKAMTAQGKDITPPQARSHWSLSPQSSQEALAPVTRLAFVEALYARAGSPTDLGANTSGFFTDLDGADDPAVAWAVQNGIIYGNGAGQFLPDDPVTREQAAVMLLRADTAAKAGPAGAWAVRVPYADAANASTWAADALMWNVIRGYLSPDAAGNFAPQAPLTAAAMEAAMAVTAAE